MVRGTTSEGFSASVFSFSLKIHALSIQLQIVHLKHTTEHSLFMLMTINVTKRSQSWFRGMLDFVEI